MWHGSPPNGAHVEEEALLWQSAITEQLGLPTQAAEITAAVCAGGAPQLPAANLSKTASY